MYSSHSTGLSITWSAFLCNNRSTFPATGPGRGGSLEEPSHPHDWKGVPLLALNMPTLDAWLLNPALHDYLAILKGTRNGFIYGVKVRFPHALIMAILFGRGE